VLTEVAATHGPAKTEGSEIRDNVAKLNNQFEDYARRALPALDVMRMALVKMTGGSEDSLRRDYEKGMRLDTQQQARRKYGWRLDAYQQEMNTLQDKGVGMQTMGPEGDRYRALKRQQQLMRQQQLNFVEQGNANARSCIRPANSGRGCARQQLYFFTIRRRRWQRCRRKLGWRKRWQFERR
jgi:hypothetical protein